VTVAPQPWPHPRWGTRAACSVARIGLRSQPESHHLRPWDASDSRQMRMALRSP